ncbi:unnamed protein product, partial [Callosobruchus maculatus]
NDVATSPRILDTSGNPAAAMLQPKIMAADIDISHSCFQLNNTELCLLNRTCFVVITSRTYATSVTLLTYRRLPRAENLNVILN